MDRPRHSSLDPPLEGLLYHRFYSLFYFFYLSLFKKRERGGGREKDEAVNLLRLTYARTYIRHSRIMILERGVTVKFFRLRRVAASITIEKLIADDSNFAVRTFYVAELLSVFLEKKSGLQYRSRRDFFIRGG